MTRFRGEMMLHEFVWEKKSTGKTNLERYEFKLWRIALPFWLTIFFSLSILELRREVLQQSLGPVEDSHAATNASRCIDPLRF